ncbi:ATP-binding protein [Saccharothrix sp. AJ9571]|nr:ATP-binding protein [Saccharothrix sp. AJ9571]
MRESERAAQVVRFWRTIEMFSPQGVPKPTFDSREESGKTVLDLAADELAPWQPDHPICAAPLREGMTWQFTIYGGLYEISAARAEMVRVFGEDNKPDDARQGGQTAMFAFTLDVEGCLVENSATLSACAWAISRLRSPGPGEPNWLDGFEFDEREFVAGLNKLVPPKLQNSTNVSEQTATLHKVGKAVAEHVKGAAVEAVTAGAEATGVAVTAAVGAGVGAVAGSVVGGIAGTVAGTFAEKLLTPGTGTKSDAEPGETAAGAPEPKIPRLQMTAQTLHEFVAELGSALGLRDALRVVGVRVACVQVPIRKSDEAGEQNFLNSYIASDLAEVEKAVCGAGIGNGLTAYLTDSRHVQVANRIDVRAGRHALISGVAPSRIPGGRWPTSTAKPLVVSQQFAVNQILDELGDSTGLFAVNGPPGTGKTTMLRDVLAAVVVKRARRLAELDDPSKAFTEVLQRVPLSKNYSPAVRGIRPELTGFEVVVATASNDAAANVTAEIPSLDAVRGAEDDALAIDYFTDLASHVLGGKAWGMVAAVLGNMKNRSAFASRFWWGDEAKKKERPAGAGPSSAAQPAEPADDPENVGMLAILKMVREQSDDIEDWGDAVASFQDAESEVRQLATHRQEVADAIAEAFRCQAAVRAAEEHLRNTHIRWEQTQDSVRYAVGQFDEASAAYSKIDGDYQNHLDRKPGFWISLVRGFRKRRRWAGGRRILEGLRSAAKSKLDQLNHAVVQGKAHLAAVLEERHRHENALNDAKRALAAVEARIDVARDRWPGRVPFGSDVEDDEAFQLCAPWADQEFTAARNRLFLAALSLHKAFLFNTERQVRGNLAVIASAVRGKVDMKPSTLLAAWQSLFIVVPMISTTFASLPRLFAGLGREALGWLFIDEAGQATPQQAVGGLWRCRRAVIVGDPQQLEPIVTLPLSAQQTLLRHHGVHEQWTPDNTSTQRIADRLARHGTALPEPDGESRIWVGAPLRVHRRCDRPMFDVSNTIAYGGDLMVYGTNHSGDYPGTNAWIDVRSGQSRGNWVPAEGEALKDLLGQLAEHGVAPRDIRVVSPFRDVVRESKEAVRRSREELPSFDWRFMSKNIGTVHTVQGQESDVIVLVLGSAPNRPGARAWAAEKPNLLNVAISRAKRRFYVIGNRDNWKDLRYFNVLARNFPVEF